MADERTDDRVYRVVLNDEEQYSIWAAARDLPAGRRAEGTEVRSRPIGPPILAGVEAPAAAASTS